MQQKKERREFGEYKHENLSKKGFCIQKYSTKETKISHRISNSAGKNKTNRE